MFWKVAAVLLLSLLGFSLFKENKSIPQTLKSSTSVSPSVKPPSTSTFLSVSPIQTEQYVVTKVIDGDTIQISKNNQTQTVRIIGADTPETVDPRKPVQCFGIEASNKAKQLLFGKTVLIEKDSTQGEKDKYGRTLAYIFLPDGTSYDKFMIEQGFAHEYTYSVPYKYQKEFKAAEVDARNNKRGLWADGACSSQTVTPTIKTTVQTQSSITSTKITNGNYVCDCSKTCGKIASCDEAYYQLEKCGCSARDSDKDGIPCEALCN